MCPMYIVFVYFSAWKMVWRLHASLNWCKNLTFEVLAAKETSFILLTVKKEKKQRRKKKSAICERLLISFLRHIFYDWKLYRSLSFRINQRSLSEDIYTIYWFWNKMIGVPNSIFGRVRCLKNCSVTKSPTSSDLIRNTAHCRPHLCHPSACHTPCLSHAPDCTCQTYDILLLCSPTAKKPESSSGHKQLHCKTIFRAHSVITAQSIRVIALCACG